jgi:uncharacterized protein (DUF2225 family)
MNQKKLYNSTLTCPVCQKPFPVTKVRLGSYRIASQDTDFAINYEGINPILYGVFVCENCGYAALSDRFDNINPKEKKIIASQISPHWEPKSYSGERTLDSALDAFKLALYCMQLLKAKSSDIAKICMRIAWIYRWKGEPREMVFLKFALEYYSDAYQNEEFPLDKMDEPHCTYLIAELHRKLGNLEEATQWFGRLFNNPKARQNHRLSNMAHDQYQLVKELKQGNK